MEASALQAPAGLARGRISIGASLLRLRSDEQLLALFRAGHDEAFRVIHDRYRQRLFAYTRQMLPGSRQDAEDALQDVFVRAYSSLRADDRRLVLRPWLYRVAHNRCIDQLRRPVPPAPELIALAGARNLDPIAEAERRESLRRLIADVRRLPTQQRSALLLRELSGMSYTELADTLEVTVPAVKSLLVRARIGLVQATQARDTACTEIRDELILAHDRGVRPNGNTRRHLRDCAGCRSFRGEIRGCSRQIAALVPVLAPVAAITKLLGIGSGATSSAAAGGGGAAASGGGAAASSGVAGTSGAVAAGGVASTGGGVLAGGLLATGASHAATLLAAVVLATGGAAEIQHTLAAGGHRANQQVPPRTDGEHAPAPSAGNEAAAASRGPSGVGGPGAASQAASATSKRGQSTLAQGAPASHAAPPSNGGGTPSGGLAGSSPGGAGSSPGGVGSGVDPAAGTAVGATPSSPGAGQAGVPGPGPTAQPGAASASTSPVSASSPASSSPGTSAAVSAKLGSGGGLNGMGDSSPASSPSP